MKKIHIVLACCYNSFMAQSNNQVVWDVVKNKIPELYPQILEIIEKD